MKLSRLTNRQLRNLLRRGEVRFSQTSEAYDDVAKQLKQGMAKELNILLTRYYSKFSQRMLNEPDVYKNVRSLMKHVREAMDDCAKISILLYGYANKYKD